MPTTSADEQTQSMGEHRSRELTMSERLMRLVKSPFFSKMNLDSLVDLSRGQVEVHGKAGDVLWERGEPSSFNARIEYGRICCCNEYGRKTTVMPVFVLGVFDMFAEIPRAYTAVAETDYIAINTPVHVFDAVVENHVETGRQIQAGLARTLLGGTDKTPDE
jgi:CRP-like cAMP-binding protein